jgi:hypothetical protein
MKSCAICTKPVPNNGGHDVADLKICHVCYVGVDADVWEEYKKKMVEQKRAAFILFISELIRRRVGQ